MIREKLRKLWYEVDGPIGVAMLVAFVFFAGTQYQYWRDSDDRAQASRERDNASHERDVLYGSIKAVRDDATITCANDKNALIESFMKVGKQRDGQIRELITLTRQRQVTTDQVLRNTVLTAKKVTEAADNAGLAAQKADEAAQKADVTQTAIEKAIQPPPLQPPQPWAGKRH